MNIFEVDNIIKDTLAHTPLKTNAVNLATQGINKITQQLNSTVLGRTLAQTLNVPLIRRTIYDIVGEVPIHSNAENRRFLGDVNLREDVHSNGAVSMSSTRNYTAESYVHRVITPTIILRTNIYDKEYKIELYNNMESFTSTKSANWTEIPIPGRFEPLVSYDSSGAKNYTITGVLLLDTPAESDDRVYNDLQKLKTNIANIQASVYPIKIAGKTTLAVPNANGNKVSREYTAITAPPLWTLYIKGKGDNLIRIPKVRINSYTMEQVGPILNKGYTAVTRVSLDISEVNTGGSNNRLDFINVPNQTFQEKATAIL